MYTKSLYSTQRLVFTLLVCSFSIIGYGQASNNSQEQGSDERVRQTSINFTDPLSGQRVYIFESIINDERGTQAVKRYYISPLVVFKLEEAASLNGIDLGNDTLLYRVPVQFHYRDLFDQVRREIGSTSISVSLMKFQRMDFTVRSMSDIKVLPFTDPIAVLLPEEGSIEFLVPSRRKSLFENLIKTPQGLGVNARISYNVLSVNRDVFEWSMEDIQESKAFKDLNSGGKEFVNAKQIQSVMRDVFSKAKMYRVTDPGMNRKLTDKELEIVHKYLEVATNQQVENRDQAAQLDSKLLKGTGLSAQEFKPITLMWDMVDRLKTVEEFSSANSEIRSFAERNKTSFSSSASVGWGPFSASVGYSKSRERLDAGFFNNQDEYNTFREQHIEGRGQEARIVFRGIKLLELTDFQNKLNLSVSSVAIEPVAQGASYLIPSSVKAESNFKSVANDLMKRLDTYVPVGTIVAYGGTKESIPEGWELCNGNPYNPDNHPELKRAIGTLWGEGQYKLPNLEGMFLRGMSPDRTLGSHQSDQVGLHSHPIEKNDPKGSYNHLYVESPATQAEMKGGLAAGGNFADGKSAGIGRFLNIADILEVKSNRTDETRETRPKNKAVYYIIKVRP